VNAAASISDPKFSIVQIRLKTFDEFIVYRLLYIITRLILSEAKSKRERLKVGICCYLWQWCSSWP